MPTFQTRQEEHAAPPVHTQMNGHAILPVAEAAIINPGIIVNPYSAKNNRHGRQLAELLKQGQADFPVEVLEDFSRLPDILTQWAGRGINLLMISSGDGTVQQIQTLIAETGLFKQPPRLCLLAHGSTNMTAAKLGFGIGSSKKLAMMLLDGTAFDTIIERHVPTIRIVNPAGSKPLHGMFVGTGAVYHATRFTQNNVHATGIKGGNLAPAITLLTAVLKTLFLPADPADEKRLDRPFDMTVTANGKTWADGPELMTILSTLDKLIIGCEPFWGPRDHPLRVSIFPYPPRFLLRWLPRVLYGGAARKLPASCRSFTTEGLRIRTNCPFVIDGEFFTGPKDADLKIELGPQFTYLCRK